MENTIYSINREMADLIAGKILKGEYTFKIKERKYDKGYIPVILSIDGEEADISVNRRGFVCWHSFISETVNDIIKKLHSECENKLVEDVFSKVMEKYFVEEGGDNE